MTDLPSDRIAERIDSEHVAAQRALTEQVLAALRSGRLERARERRMQLAAVLATLDQLGAAVDPLARKLVTQAWADGSEQAAHGIARQTGRAPAETSSFTGVTREGVAALEDSLLGRLTDAHRTVGRQVQDVYAHAGRRAALRAMLGADGSPQTARAEMIRQLMRDRQVRALLASDGVTGFIDRSGARWTLGQYAQMAVRTVTREAVVQGAVTRMASHGVTLARVSTSAKACPLCLPYENRLVSLDGSTDSWDGEPAFDLGALPNGGPPFHPNCRHSLMPVVTSIELRRREMESTGA